VIFANFNRRLSCNKDPTTNQNLIDKLRGPVKEQLMAYVRSFYDHGVAAFDCVDVEAHESEDEMTNSEHDARMSARVNGFLKVVLAELGEKQACDDTNLSDYSADVLIGIWKAWVQADDAAKAKKEKAHEKLD